MLSWGLLANRSLEEKEAESRMGWLAEELKSALFQLSREAQCVSSSSKFSFFCWLFCYGHCCCRALGLGAQILNGADYTGEKEQKRFGGKAELISKQGQWRQDEGVVQVLMLLSLPLSSPSLSLSELIKEDDQWLSKGKHPASRNAGSQALIYGARHLQLPFQA